MMRNPLKNSRSGFTLVEVLIAMAISSLLLGAVYSIFTSSQNINTSNEVTARIMQSLRTSLDLMESDIRMAGLTNHMLNNTSIYAGIVDASGIKLQFTADRNMDGTINTLDPAHLAGGLQESDFEQITYSYNAATKQLRQCLSEGTANESWDTVSDNVDSFNFSYFDVNNNVIANPALNLTSICSVKVTITVGQPAGRAGNISRTMSRQILCRNFAM